VPAAPGVASIAAEADGFAVVRSSARGGDSLGEGEGSRLADFFGDAVLFGLGDGDLLDFFFFDLASEFRLDGLDDVLVFFSLGGAGVAS
jgi:hypothetical protein